jgi:SAM-dependent methyltransferase
MDRQAHWENVYQRRKPDDVSWFQIEPRVSLNLIGRAGIEHDDCVIDIGGGASALIDHLVTLEYRCLAVLDISASALAVARGRLGAHASRVEWLTADITEFEPAKTYALWHDRAVFHFLIDAADRQRYVRAMEKALSAGGQAIIATFGEDGPTRCSDLPVERYSPERLAETLGSRFELVESVAEEHRTPKGVVQHFCYCRFHCSGG